MSIGCGWKVCVLVLISVEISIVLWDWVFTQPCSYRLFTLHNDRYAFEDNRVKLNISLSSYHQGFHGRRRHRLDYVFSFTLCLLCIKWKHPSVSIE